MASANPAAVADRLRETLRDLLAVEEIRRYIGVHEELQKLKGTVLSTRAVLDDAVEKASRNASLASWVQQIQEVFHEVDDAVDELRTEILWKRELMCGDRVVTKVCISLPITFNHLVFRRKLRELREHVEDFLHRRHKFMLVAGAIELNRASLLASDTQNYVRFSEENLFGRDSDLEAIVENLVRPYSEEQNVSIISLVGTAGLGKTALARKAFDHERVVGHFGLRIWVDVSGAFEATRIADSILKYVTRGSKPSEDEEIELILEKELAGRKYLLVLDDVRSIVPDRWLDFKRLLMSGAEGSRILLTTRSISNARIAGGVTTHMLSSLSEEDSMTLFEIVAFQGQEPPSIRIKEIARDIVSKCHGVPLIIRTVGKIGQEIGTTNEREWLTMRDAYLDRLIIEEGTDVVSGTLKLSFDRLPSHLKDCFAYCSLFSKDHEIDVQKLIFFWAAQGFIKLSDPSQNMEDVGYDQFLYLLDRDFFETVERDMWGKTTKCKISDRMHDLAAAVAGDECISFGLDFDHQNVLYRVPRHVSFDFSLSSPRQIPTSFPAARLRSILFTCQSSIKQEGSSSRAICDAIISNMKFLRTLDLHDSGIERVPDHIDGLKHLRYLDLSRNVKMRVLPKSITKLRNLRTLKLSLCFRLQELPSDIKKLANLRHLEIDGCYNLTHMPRGLGELTQLRTLSQFVLSKDARSVSQHDIGQLNELSSLNKLRGELQIKNLRHDMNLASACLEMKPFLQSLALDWEIDSIESEGHEVLLTSFHCNLGGLTLNGFGGFTLPFGPSTHSNLMKLVLRRCPNCRYLPSLHLFPSLKVLVLEDMVKLECVSEYVKDGDSIDSLVLFPSLQELHLAGLPLLRSWWRGMECNEDHMFPCLSKLFIEDCPELVSMPLFPNLEEGLVLDSCNLKPLQDTLKVKTEHLRFWKSTPADEASSSTSISALPYSFSPPLSKLKNLSIVGIEEFDNKEADGITWESLTSLQYLRLDYLPSLESLPDRMRHFTRLRELHIWRCSFTVLPEWIVDLKILKKLSIWICPDLKSLPEKIGSLTSLRTLEIEDCPVLVHRCQRKAGADWDKISRIPDLRIDLSSRR